MEQEDLQKEAKVKEVKEVKEVEEVKEIEKKPEGFYISEVVTATANVIAFDDKQVSELDLLTQLANHAKEQTGFKLAK